MRNVTHMLGIDVGGSGIKGAPVDLEAGEMAVPRRKVLTPQPSTPEACAGAMATIIEQFADQIDGPIGVAVPAPVLHGVTPFMANLDQSWVGLDADAYLSEKLGREVVLVNDADAAGVAEMQYGAGRGKQGTVVLTTLGTGVGTALFHDGRLVPNTEFGHIEINGRDAESRAASSYMEREHISYKKWAKHLQRYYSTLEKLLWPDLFIVGGGVSREYKRFLPLLNLQTPIVPASLRNGAGTIGAALAASLRVGANVPPGAQRIASVPD
ncbi:MAG: polyphosphate--glucose phosphotransferase [Propionibacterium freudenreichii]